MLVFRTVLFQTSVVSVQLNTECSLVRILGATACWRISSFVCSTYTIILHCIVYDVFVCVHVYIAQAMDYRALWQFRDMIICANPDAWPVLDYADYGCYCGKGGSGTPVDDLDRWVCYFFWSGNASLSLCMICEDLCNSSTRWKIGTRKQITGSFQ